MKLQEQIYRIQTLMIIREETNEAFDPPQNQVNNFKFIKKTIERLEDGYMIKDWTMVREVISDLKYKLKNL